MAEETDSSTLWGSNRALRNLHLQPPVECVADEEAKLDEMHALMGPFASRERLTSHLRAVRGKVSWAVNRYLREELMSGTITDFDPKPFVPTQASFDQRHKTDECHDRATALANQTLGGVDATVESTVDWEQLPDCLMDLVLAQLNHQDLLQISASCKWLRRLASSNSLWKSLYLARWGMVALSAVKPDQSVGDSDSTNIKTKMEAAPAVEMESAVSWPSPVVLREGSVEEVACQSLTASCQSAANESLPADDSAVRDVSLLGETVRGTGWKEWFHHKFMCEQATQCPQCLSSKVQPIVYGFPSGALVEGMKSARLLLGGDHLTDYPGFSPLWACNGCSTRWLTHPYSSRSIGPLHHMQGLDWRSRSADAK